MEYTRQVDIIGNKSGPEGWSDSDEEEEEATFEHEELYEQMETMALRDEYRGHARNTPLVDEEHYSSDSSVMASTSKKHQRRK